MRGSIFVLAACLALSAVSAVPLNYEISSSSNGNSPITSVSYSSPNWGGYFVCPCEGDFQDPNSNGFFSCVPDGNGGFIAYRKPCPYGTAFNPKIDACDWVENSKKLYYPGPASSSWPAPAPPSWPVPPQGKWA